MAITELSTDLGIISALNDEPNDVSGLSAAQLKAKFDEGPNGIKTYLNETLIPELDAEHLPYLYGSSNTIKDTMEQLAAGVMPDESVTEAKLSSDISAKVNLSQKNLINILRLKLQFALSANDIDAWSDLFADETELGTISNLMVAGGALKLSENTITALSTSTTIYIGSSSASMYFGQTFIAQGTTFPSITVKLKKYGAPTDGVKAEIRAVPSSIGSVLYTSTNTVNAADISGSSYTDCTFNFTGVSLTRGTTYFVDVYRTSGTYSSSNNYYVGCASGGGSPGKLYYASGTPTWTEQEGYDMCFTINYASSGYAIWNAVTGTQALTYAAITSDQAEGTGTITWYLSDDGTNWTEITSLDAIQTVSFDSASVYLKCVITENAEVSAVAWGGY